MSEQVFGQKMQNCTWQTLLWRISLPLKNSTTVKRTPGNYTSHIQDFKRLFGSYEFEITELIASNDKVYVRWKQTGKHMAEIDGFEPTQLPLVEFTSAVYRVENKKIVEYWIQMDRLGFDLQLQANKEKYLAK